ncbi:Vacuolar protein sorting-associated protein 72, partial [Coemansia sp. RSA 2399]
EIDALLAKADRKRKRKLAKKQRIVPRFAARQTTEKVNKRQTGASPPPSVDEDVAEQVGTNNKKKKKADFAVRFSSRASAVRKAQETVARQQERDLMAAVKRTKRHGKHTAAGAAANSDDELTQEQLLEEAKLTESENLEKLSEFQQLEAEELRRQRMAGARKAPLLVRPVVHWKSSLEASTSNSTGAIDSAVAAAAAPRMHYSLEHLDRKHYPFNYWSKSLSIVPPKVCPITGQPARYFHPRAKVPYANMRAYHVLEEMMRGGHAYFYDIGVWSSTDIASGHEQ